MAALQILKAKQSLILILLARKGALSRVNTRVKTSEADKIILIP